MLALGLGFSAHGTALGGSAIRASLGYGLPPGKVPGARRRIGLTLGAASMSAVVGSDDGRLGCLDWTAAAAGHGGPAVAKTRRPEPRERIGGGPSSRRPFLRGAMHSGIERESGSPRRRDLDRGRVLSHAFFFFASFRIPAAEVSASSGVAPAVGHACIR